MAKEVPVWEVKWGKIDGVDVLGIEKSRYAAFPTNGKKSGRMFQAFDTITREPLCQLNHKEVSEWLVKMAQGANVPATNVMVY